MIARAALRRAAPWLRSLWRLLREFTGDSAYERYLAHRAVAHPGEPVLSEKRFWRLRTDSRPSSGCC
ncbi:YbdD/YjiX family protein [Actinocorallia aurea]